ncbi:MAG: hypothetical protein U9Q94_00120, partial [Candidatus Bipolaricaulota bacterium]|nr:hypothetical protein [Candidatus Bipolaricaulota bacterium]
PRSIVSSYLYSRTRLSDRWNDEAMRKVDKRLVSWYGDVSQIVEVVVMQTISQIGRTIYTRIIVTRHFHAHHGPHQDHLA